MAKKYRTKKLKCVVVIGIGGSNLGTKAIYDALRLYTSSEHACTLIFLESVSSGALLSTSTLLKSFQDPEAFLLVTISKSGGTTETIVNMEALFETLQTSYKKDVLEKRCVVISDEGSKFWLAAKEKHIDCLAIPKMVGGRFSVFSAVGLFPLALVGINVRALLEGAKMAIENGLSRDTLKNHALISACTTFIHAKKSRSIHNSFFFAPELESLGKWYRQLMGESIGKEKDLEGKIVHTGLTPIISIGSTDLHSMAQLYFGGADDKFTNIISVQKSKRVSVPKSLLFPNLVDHLTSKSFDDVMSAIVGGVCATYKKINRPFLSIELEHIHEQELGYYLQFRMIEMMYLAELLNVNCFDQPNVELYKVETRKLLQ
ncbi:MAG: hypothetical protein AAB664_04365 [Patescibacteria group bacterium]